jgi:hypothetical protein
MELGRLAERERSMCPEVQAFLARMSPEHQSFWLSQRRDRLRLGAEERHKFIVHQALACNPLLTTDEINEFCMQQQGMIYEDLRAEGAPICSTAWFDWRLDKDLWDRWVGSATGEPSMWADDAPPLDRSPYLDGYQLTVGSLLSSLPSSPSDSNYIDANGGHHRSQHQNQYQNQNQNHHCHSLQTAPADASGSNVEPSQKPSRPHSSTGTDSVLHSPKRTSFGVDSPKPPSRGSGLSRLSLVHKEGVSAHVEDANGMQSMFKVVNY